MDILATGGPMASRRQIARAQRDSSGHATVGADGLVETAVLAGAAAPEGLDATISVELKLRSGDAQGAFDGDRWWRSR